MKIVFFLGASIAQITRKSCVLYWEFDVVTIWGLTRGTSPGATVIKQNDANGNHPG
jgi:hypothetical protein